jgi:branched-chain amino acid transport system substrate-binding protein
MGEIMYRRTLLASAGPLAATIGLLGRIGPAGAQTPGVTATEIKIGQTEAYSGPASAYGAIGRGLSAFFKRVNDQGGVAGRMINFISVDDGYLPPKTVEQTRRLVEQEGVSFMLNGLGTPTNSAVQRYLNQKKVPQLFVSSGADKWASPKEFPWTIGWQPSYRTEAQVFAKYILANKPDGKLAILYQNDDFGKDYIVGLRDVLGERYDRMVVKAISYEVTDPTIDSQAVTLQGSGADMLVTAATPKFAAQVIRKIYDLGWKPLHFLTNVSGSVGAVITPAGPERAVGIVLAAYLKEISDPDWKNDPGMNEWRTFMKDYMPDSDITDANYAYSYGVGSTTLQMLKQSDGNFSRENIMRQATNLHDLQLPTLLPGVIVATSPTNYHPIRHIQLARWNGTRWERFGGVIEGAGS